MGETNFQPEPSNIISSEEELQKIVNEKMCVLRSLGSVAKAFAQKDYTLDQPTVEKRLAQMNHVESKAAQKFREWVEEEKRMGRTTHAFSILDKVEKINKETLSEDSLNVKKFINSLTGGDLASSLKEGLEDTVARYRVTLSYNELLKTLKNPDNQVCIILPQHMAHISLDKEDNLVSLSDRDLSGNPVRIDKLYMALYLFSQKSYSNDHYNLIVFSKEEKVQQKDLDKIDDNFLDPVVEDQDFQTVLQRIKNLKNQPLYSPSINAIEKYIYPEIRNYVDPESSKGQLNSDEALAIGYLARKAAVLHQAEGESDEIADKVDELYLKKTKESGITDLPTEIWQYDVIESIKTFIEYIAIAANARKKLQQEKDKTEKEKPSRFPFFTKKKAKSIQDIHFERQKNEYQRPLIEDQYSIGEKTTEKIVEIVSSWTTEFITNNPQGASQEEVKARIASQILGLNIARSFYLESLKLSKSLEEN